MMHLFVCLAVRMRVDVSSLIALLWKKIISLKTQTKLTLMKDMHQQNAWCTRKQTQLCGAGSFLWHACQHQLTMNQNSSNFRVIDNQNNNKHDEECGDNELIFVSFKQGITAFFCEEVPFQNILILSSFKLSISLFYLLIDRSINNYRFSYIFNFSLKG